MKDHKYMKPGEVMEYLRISHNTLFKLRQQGLPFIKWEKKILFDRDAIDAWMKGKEVILFPKKPKKPKK
jgi:excisionase family DNA binding protein